MLADAVNTTDALLELSAAFTTSMGISLAIDGKNNKVKSTHREMVKRAFPMQDRVEDLNG